MTLSPLTSILHLPPPFCSLTYADSDSPLVLQMGTTIHVPSAPEKASMARSDVEVRETLSGKIWGIHKGRRIEMREVERLQRAAPSNATKENKGEPPKTHTPAPNHPWKRSFRKNSHPGSELPQSRVTHG